VDADENPGNHPQNVSGKRAGSKPVSEKDQQPPDNEDKRAPVFPAGSFFKYPPSQKRSPHGGAVLQQNGVGGCCKPVGDYKGYHHKGVGKGACPKGESKRIFCAGFSAGFRGGEKKADYHKKNRRYKAS
jgi:hypothetical protein